MWVLIAPVFWGASGGEAGETVRTAREWTPGFWECIGCTLARVPKVPEEGISPDPPRRRDSRWGRARAEGRGRAQPGRQPGPARAPPAPLPFSRSPLLPWTSALYIRPHLTSRPTSSPLAGWFPVLPIYLPWVPGRQTRLNPLTSQPRLLRLLAPSCFSLLPFLISSGRSGAHKPQSGSASPRNLDSSSPILPTPNLAPSFSLHFFSS